jgi:hypothetical protein
MYSLCCPLALIDLTNGAFIPGGVIWLNNSHFFFCRLVTFQSWDSALSIYNANVCKTMEMYINYMYCRYGILQVKNASAVLRGHITVMQMVCGTYFNIGHRRSTELYSVWFTLTQSQCSCMDKSALANWHEIQLVAVPTTSFQISIFSKTFFLQIWFP